jgi:hypothetical protein
VTVGGVVTGTWSRTDDELTIDWFPESGRAPADALEREIDRLASLLDRSLRVAVKAA